MGTGLGTVVSVAVRSAVSASKRVTLRMFRIVDVAVEEVTAEEPVVQAPP